MHIVHQPYKQTNDFDVLPRSLKSRLLIRAAVCAVNQRDQLDGLFFQAFANGVFILISAVARNQSTSRSYPDFVVKMPSKIITI